MTFLFIYQTEAVNLVILKTLELILIIYYKAGV